MSVYVRTCVSACTCKPSRLCTYTSGACLPETVLLGLRSWVPAFACMRVYLRSPTCVCASVLASVRKSVCASVSVCTCACVNVFAPAWLLACRVRRSAGCIAVWACYQFDESPGVEQKVLGLEVPVDDALAVQVLEGLYHTRHAETRRQVIEVAPGEYRATLYITQHQKLASQFSSLRTDMYKEVFHTEITCLGSGCVAVNTLHHQQGHQARLH